MDTLSDMKLDKKKQISYRSTDDIVSKLDLAAAKLAAERVTFGGAKLRTGHLVNAIALWVGEMSADELVRFAGPKLAALESYLGRLEDEPDDRGDLRRQPHPGLGEDRKLGTVNIPIYRRQGETDLGAGPEAKSRPGRRRGGDK